MANGTDGEALTRPLQAPGLTWSVVAARTAETFAFQAAQHDLSATAETPHLLDLVDPSTTPDDPAFRAQLAALVWRLHARRPDEATLGALTELWTAANTRGGATGAWTTVLTVLLRDPDFLTY
jgi:hypothetical protein